jgi:hypothetical protein
VCVCVCVLQFGRRVTSSVHERGYERELESMNRLTKLMQVANLI